MKYARFPWAVAAALLFSLASCSKSEGKSPPAALNPPPAPAAKSERTPVPAPVAETPAPAPEPAPEPAPKPAAEPTHESQLEPAPKPPPNTSDVSITGFETGASLDAEGHVAEPKTAFAPEDTVHLSVQADGAARTVKIAVSWIGPDDVRIREDVQDATLGAPKVLAFSLANEQGLAKGLYRAEIRIEDRLASTAEFEVR